MTDNEIIKALEGAILNAKKCDSKVWSIELYKLENALDLITRQQAENENLKVENQSFRSAANSLKMHYEEAQAEVERLEKETKDKERAYNDEFCLRKEWQTKCRELLEEKQTAKAEAVKEFAERLKNKIKTECNPYGKPDFDYDTSIKILNFIDKLAKEMVGDDNA